MTAQTTPVGAQFGWPGHTSWYEQVENNSGQAIVLQQGAQTPATSILPLRRADTVFDLKIAHSIAQTVTANSQTITTSAYFPYNLVGPHSLSLNGKYQVYNVQSGIDIAILNAYRSWRSPQRRNTLYAAPVALPYSAQSNLVSSGTYTDTSPTLQFALDYPLAIFFDEYFNLDSQSKITAIAHETYVSPQYFNLLGQDVLPNLNYSPLLGANTDQAPYVATGVGTAATASGTATLDIRRLATFGVDATQPGDQAPTWQWNYAFQSQRAALAGQSSYQIPLRAFVGNGGAGQILSFFIRMFDPAAGSGVGAPIDLSTLSTSSGAPAITITKGNGAVLYQDSAATMQRRTFDQHDLRLPIGVILYDLALDERNHVTNARAHNLALNDLNVTLNFTSPTSSSAYAVIGVETLTYLPSQTPTTVG